MNLETIIFLLIYGGTWTSEAVNSPCDSPQYLPLGTRSTINCLFVGSFANLQWYAPTDQENAVIAIRESGKTGTGLLSGEYDIFANGSLIINTVTLEHEGTFTALFLRTLKSTAERFDVEVFVFEAVNSPCDSPQYLPLGTRSTINCLFVGSFANLQWYAPTDQENAVIAIWESLKTGTGLLSGEYDIFANGSLIINTVTLEHEGTFTALFLRTLKSTAERFDVEVFVFDETSTNNTPSETSQDFPFFLLTIVVAGVVLMMMVMMITAILKGHFPTRRPRTEEHIPMVSSDRTKVKDFIDQLIVRYEDLCYSVQPIPNLPGNPCCINRVFVDSGLKYLDTNEQNGRLAKAWKKMGSYTTILNDLQKHSLRCIVEGEPGYGKSMLSLQLAYDWYTSITDSTQQTESVLILLRLRELSETSSIYSAIKEYLLPLDTKLSESDIEDILSDKNRSVVVVMDGFDEYPHKNSTNDITSIIVKKKCQSFKVIITTRTSHLPNDYPPLTKRIRLTGFGKTAMEQYIGKLVPDDDETKFLNIIQRRITEIRLLNELCQVPLFFVLFVQLILENEQFQSFQSVTTFFRSLMKCLCNHMKRKMTVEKSELHIISKTDLRKLEEFAFHALCDENPKLTWLKEDLLERLGRDVYDHYISMGILIEEDAVDFVDMQRKKNVRFYHDIFCEWFAAHRLTDISETNLRYPDPFRFQYVYRFACGINWRASGHIWKILHQYDDFIFFFLCMLELDGRFGDKLERINFLCSSTVLFEVLQSRLLQRSVKEVLDVASSNKIPVSRLWLYDCYHKVDPSPEINIQLKSHTAIPVLPTLLGLWIQETGGEIIRDEVTHILQYCLRCEKLTELRFLDCLLPYVAQTEHLSALNARNFKVTWQPQGFLETGYQLNLVSGTWESTGDDAAKMTNEDYVNEVTQFNILHRHREMEEPR